MKRSWQETPVIIRRSMIASLCSRTRDYLSNTTSSNIEYFHYWSERILNHNPLSDSPYMDRYYFGLDDKAVVSLYVMDDDGEFIDLSYNIKEVKLFVYNAFNEVPFHSPMVEAIRSGKKKFELVRDGLDSVKYGSLTDSKVGKPRKDSLRQKILRGELTRYEAYEKNKKKKD